MILLQLFAVIFVQNVRLFYRFSFDHIIHFFHIQFQEIYLGLYWIASDKIVRQKKQQTNSNAAKLSYFEISHNFWDFTMWALNVPLNTCYIAILKILTTFIEILVQWAKSKIDEFHLYFKIFTFKYNWPRFSITTSFILKVILRRKA